MIDETIVPNNAGAAPNFPARTSHSLEVMKPRPNVLIAGHAATIIATPISIRSSGTKAANAVVTTVYARSPTCEAASAFASRDSGGGPGELRSGPRQLRHRVRSSRRSRARWKLDRGKPGHELCAHLVRQRSVIEG